MARFPGRDARLAATVRKSYEANLVRHRDALPGAAPDRLIYAWAAVANDLRELAFLVYADGDPLADVRGLLLSAARAHLELVRLRGHDTTPNDAPRPPEFATGHSRSTAHAVLMALASGEDGLARSLAPFVWDPSDASYVAPDSVLCTNKHQALAYALKHVVAGDTEAAGTQLRRLATVPDDLAGELLMMRGLVARAGPRVLEGLGELLPAHARAAKKDPTGTGRQTLCLPALGLAALAVARGLVTPEQLPAGDPYFARDLVAARKRADG